MIEQRNISHSIPLFTISEVIAGKGAALFKRAKSLPEEVCLTIKHGHMRSLDIVFSSPDRLEVWMVYLTRFVPKSYQLSEGSKFRCIFNQYSFGLEEMDLADSAVMLVELCYAGTRNEVLERLQEADMSGDGRLNFYNFYFMIQVC